MSEYIAQSHGIANEKITEQDDAIASLSQSEDKESMKQKEQQVSTQNENAQAQDKAKSKDAIQDAKALKDKANKELGKIPQKIEDVEDDIIDSLRKSLGSSPNVKNVKLKLPSGIEYKKPDFDPDKAINNINKTLDPILNTSASLQSVAGKIPLLGDLTTLLTKLTSDTSGESGISKEELYELCPNQPEMPPSIVDKAGKIVKLTGQAILYLPIFLVDVIVQILKVIYDMFKQIKNAIGVPPIPYPFTLIDDLVELVPKVKRFILTAPPEIEDLVEQKLKDKFRYATALSIPKPNVKTPSTENLNNGDVSQSKTEETKTVQQSIPPPVDSGILETPSVPSAKPMSPIANDCKPILFSDDSHNRHDGEKLNYPLVHI